jgi:hypothetical protein
MSWDNLQRVMTNARVPSYRVVALPAGGYKLQFYAPKRECWIDVSTPPLDTAEIAEQVKQNYTHTLSRIR